jgi:uncharacterized protein (UPF0332 family)
VSAKEQREEVVAYWWTKAQESLCSSEREYQAGATSFAINRIYYAAFYAVSALLLEKRLSFKKHTGVRALFHHEFIKTGIIDISWGKLYDRFFEDRQEGDYIPVVDFEKDYVRDQLDLCKQFLSILEPLIKGHS